MHKTTKSETPGDGTNQSQFSERLNDLECRLQLMGEIESAFSATQSALLRRDLEGLQRANQRLAHGQRLLEGLGHISVGKRAPQSSPPEPTRALMPNPSHAPIAREREVTFALREAQTRVLFLGRVQAALLERAQRSLAMLATRLADSAGVYGPPPAIRTTPAMRDVALGARPCRV